MIKNPLFKANIEVVNHLISDLAMFETCFNYIFLCGFNDSMILCVKKNFVRFKS
jgi:hypothetical protein